MSNVKNPVGCCYRCSDTDSGCHDPVTCCHLCHALSFAGRYNQENAIRMACHTGLAECRNLTSTWFSQWMDDPQHNGLVCWLHPRMFHLTNEPAFTRVCHQDSSEPPVGGVLQRHRGRWCSRVGLWLVTASGSYSSQ